MKKLSKSGILAVMISIRNYTSQNSFKFGEGWIQKKTRCLGATLFNSEKFNELNLRIIAKTERN